MAHLSSEHLTIRTIKTRGQSLTQVQHAQMMVLAAGLAAITIVAVAAVIMTRLF